jgi:L-aspartate oxidase
MKEYHPMGSLAPRDVVARAIDKEMKRTGEPCVYLDIRHADSKRTLERFPNISTKCREYGIDITQNLIPVVPAAHYVCGGVMVDIDGRTSIDNLYAGGEVACTGVHGANRLASNSLLEAVVFSKRSARSAGERAAEVNMISADTVPPWDDSGTVEPEEWILLSHNRMEIGTIMWDYVGIVRSDLRLKRALRRANLLEKEIEDFYKRTKIIPQLLELRNIITTAKLIITCAMKRKESRGLHFTTNYPDTNDRYWKHDTIVRNPHCP